MYLLCDIIFGLAIGAMAAVCFIYVFRSKYSYPRWMLQSFENPWVFIVLFTLALFLMIYDQKIASLLLILTLALFVDMFIFAKYIPIEKMSTPLEDHGVSLLPLTVDPPISAYDDLLSAPLGRAYIPDTLPVFNSTLL